MYDNTPQVIMRVRHWKRMYVHVYVVLGTDMVIQLHILNELVIWKLIYKLS